MQDRSSWVGGAGQKLLAQPFRGNRPERAHVHGFGTDAGLPFGKAEVVNAEDAPFEIAVPRFAKDLRRLEHDIVSLVEGTGNRRDENGLSRNGPERFFEKGWTKRFLAMEIPGARRIKGDVVAIPFRPPHEETAVPHDLPFPGSGMAVEIQRSETHRQPKRTATASADVIPKAVSRWNPCVQVRNQQSLKVDDDRNRGSPAEKTETPFRSEHVDQIGVEAVDNPQAIRNVPFVLFCQFEKPPHFRQMASVAQNGEVGNRPVLDGVGNAGTEKRK